MLFLGPPEAEVLSVIIIISRIQKTFIESGQNIQWLAHIFHDLSKKVDIQARSVALGNTL